MPSIAIFFNQLCENSYICWKVYFEMIEEMNNLNLKQ
jgi:hypothetical protein